jgi:hypothetical protein
LHQHYTCTADFEGTSITITQHQQIYLYVRFLLTSTEGNVVDRTRVDRYDIGIGGDGSLKTSVTSFEEDHSERPHLNAFLNWLLDNINGLVDEFSGHLGKMTGMTLERLPIELVQNYVFPGGNTFAFQNVQFSDNQDLVAFITYVDPVNPTTVAPTPTKDVKAVMRASMKP